MKTNKRENAFHFKHFSVVQTGCGMPVSTDGVLLGAWFNVHQGQRLLDIGTGTGLLALMAAQRFPDITIDAIELDPLATQVAQYNVNQSKWADRISVEQRDILSYQVAQPYDTIVCNPPYFTSGVSAQQSQRATARHALDLSHQTLLGCCDTLLTSLGRASFILPTIEADKMIEHAQQQGWSLTRRWRIQATPTKPISRVLFELSKPPQTLREERKLIIRHPSQHDSGYSAEFIELTCAFYLKM
jgi:tRNA1Val (adenine37-N6)-methyltransferase